jgi:hypothetical protein
MSDQRWARWLGVSMAVVAVALLLSRIQPAVEAGRKTAPPVAGTCPGPAPLGSGGEGTEGNATPSAGAGGARERAWWRITDELDADGALVGRTLVAGVAARTTLTMQLGAESMARGPVDGLLVVTSDDGATSKIRVVSIVASCSWLVHEDTDVVRSAILDGTGHVAYAHLVQRETRVDLGIFQVAAGDPRQSLDRILEPLAPQADLGPIWATELRLDATGGELAVQSCSDRGCLARVVTLSAFGRPSTVIRGPRQGTILGLAGDRLVTWAFCDGLPCAVQAWTAGPSKPMTLVDRAVGAGLTADGRYLVVVTDAATGRALRVDVETGAVVELEGISPGELPLGGAVTSTVGLEVASDEIGLSTSGGDPRAFDPGAAAAKP